MLIQVVPVRAPVLAAVPGGLSDPSGILAGMSTEELSRGVALAYRAVAHQLDPPARSTADLAVLGVGVQDTPPGTTAHLALRARLPAGVQPTDDDLVLVHSIRGTLHVHREADLPLLAAALRPDEARDLLRPAHGAFFAEAAAAGTAVGDALDQVSAAMAGVMADRRPRTKGELSTALNEVVDRRLRPWCAGCGVAHVHDGLFRMASLPAGLVLRQTAEGTTAFHRVEPRTTEGKSARRELLRRFLRLAGPTDHRVLGNWLGITPAAAKRWWSLAGDLVPVMVDGTTRAMHADDLAEARGATPAKTAHLLPPYDPLLALADRALLLPDAAHRRRLWRAVASPGAVLIGGEIRGTWRRGRGELGVEPFGALTGAERRLLAQSKGDAE
jgi:hypothetical protein